jgi:transposase
MLCFIGSEGLQATFMTEGTFDREKYVECLREYALSGLVQQHPGRQSVWIFDGARIHCHHSIVEYLRDLGIVPLFLPAYCPFYNPIEIVFGLIKKRLQKRYSEGQVSNNSVPVVVSTILQEFRTYRMKKLFQKCGYASEGKFNPGIAYDQNQALMCDLGFT